LQSGRSPLIRPAGTPPNPPETPYQIHAALGENKIGELAGKLGITPTVAASLLATALPLVIDKL